MNQGLDAISSMVTAETTTFTKMRAAAVTMTTGVSRGIMGSEETTATTKTPDGDGSRGREFQKKKRQLFFCFFCFLNHFMVKLLKKITSYVHKIPVYSQDVCTWFYQFGDL